MDEILAEFIAETRETLEAVTGELVAWEAEPGHRERLDAIFRFVHTVKGSCGFLDLPRLEKLSHAAESALADVRGGRRTPDGALVSAILAIIDRIAELVEALDSGEAVPADGDDALIAALADSAEAEPHHSAEAVTSAARGTVRSIRISLDLLDTMMAGVSDLVLARNELSRRLQDGELEPQIEGAFERLSVCVADMRDAITRTRMQRIEKLFSGVPRLVRDLARDLGKSVDLQIEGGDVELDREMIEIIRDPLTHIIRNALDHGIESPAERARAGKPSAGRLLIDARQSGNQIILEISDDGRGIDADRLVEKAIAAGVITTQRAMQMTHEAKLELVFQPGLSTARSVTEISGRGVGMDVVRANIERIGGLVDITSVFGKGLTLCLRVPLTLSIMPALTVGIGGHQFAIPRSAIQEIVRENGASVRIEPLGGRTIVRLRDRRLPVVDAATLLGLEPEPEGPRALVILNPAGGQSYALAISALHDHQELVIRPSCPAIMSAGVYAGMALPDTGLPMLLLDPAGIAEKAGILGVDLAEAATEAAVAQDDPGVSMLLFLDLDGQERAVRLGVVERIEDVRAGQVAFAAGRLRLSVEGRLIPLVCGEGLGDREMVTVLRLNDGAVELAYAIQEVVDIVSHTGEIVPAKEEGIVAGAALIQDRQIEILDPHWLFSGATGAVAAATDRPLCLLPDRQDPWMTEVLRPLVESAGYRVVFAGDVEPDAADIVIAGEAAMSAEPSLPPGKILRLRSDIVARGGDAASIYRYDRAGLMDALRARRAGGQA